MVQILFGVEGLLFGPHDNDHEEMETRHKSVLVPYVRVSRGQSMEKQGNHG